MNIFWFHLFKIHSVFFGVPTRLFSLGKLLIECNFGGNVSQDDPSNPNLKLTNRLNPFLSPRLFKIKQSDAKTKTY